MTDRHFDDVIGGRVDELRRREDLAGLDRGATAFADGRATDFGIHVPEQFRASAAEDRERMLEVPDFAEHPCPPVAQFIYMMRRKAGVPPPWRVRVSQALVAACNGIGPLARYLAAGQSPPLAQIVMDPDGRHVAPMVTMVPEPIAGDPGRMVPQFLIEYDFRDQLGTAVPHTAPGKLILPDDVGRTRRTM